MTKTNNKILFVRVTAILLAVIALLSAFSGITVNAKAGDKVTITFGYCYDTGGNIIRFAQKVTHNGVTVGVAGEELCKIFANKKEAYCIQPGISLHTGDKLTESGSTIWKKLGTAKQKAINIALLYGKPGNSKNLSGTADQKWIATQLIVWEIVAGCRKTSDTYACTNNKFINGMCAGGKNAGVKTAYNQISNALKGHLTVPSFANRLKSKAKTHAMKVSSGKYTLTLSDSNSVLSKFSFKTTSGVSVSKSGNKLTLSATKPVDTVTFDSKKTVPTVSKSSTLVPYGDSSKQDVISGVENAPDPVMAYFKISAKGGNMKIKKTSEDGKVSGIKFTVTGPNSYKKTVKTDSSGNFNLTDLVPGKYTVTENKYSRYESQKSQTVTVSAGKTATVSFKNVLKKSEFSIVKKDAVTKKTVEIAGFKFKIRKPDGSYVKVNGEDTFETDDEGVVSFETRLDDGTYELIEVAAGEGYLLDGEAKEFKVSSNSTEIEVVKYDYPEMGTITINKVGDVFASVTETDGNGFKKYQPVYNSSSLEGAEFEIRAAEDIDTGDGTIRAKKGDLVDTVTTEEEGKAVSKELYLGTYIVKETKTPDGYIADGKEYEVTIKYGGEKVEVTNADITIQNTRQKAEVSLSKTLETDEKYGIGNNDELSKVSFGLYANETLEAEDGKKIPADGLIEIVQVNEDGTATFTTDIPVGAYYVKEYTTDSKYVLDDTHYEFTFDASTEGEVQQIAVNNGEDIVNNVAYGTAKTIKVDAEYPKNKLSGAVFEVYADNNGDKKFTDKKDTLVGEMTEFKKGEYKLDELPIGGYFLYEKEAPKNFVKDSEYHYFAITKDGETVNVQNEAGKGFINKPATGYLEITKRDVSDGKLLPDAGFRIKDENGKTVVEGYTDKHGIAKFALRVGKYTYEEFDAPDGYIIDTKPHKFEIKEDGQIVKAKMTNKKQPKPHTPQTGDDNNYGFFVGLGAIALGGLIAFIILKIKNRDEEDDD